MKVSIDEIDKVTSLLLSKLKESKGDEIEINNDYYWDIAQDELYNPYEEPANITLGQLSYDYELVQKILKTDTALMYHLKCVAGLLKALSIENPTAF